MNVATLGKIKRGAQSPSPESLVRSASALGVNDDDTLVAGITAANYGPKKHQITVRDLIVARDVTDRNNLRLPQPDRQAAGERSR